MTTPIQDSLVPYRSGYDIVIPRGPEPVRALTSREAESRGNGVPYLRWRPYTYTAPETGPGSVYSATGAPSALAVETVGRIIDILA